MDKKRVRFIPIGGITDVTKNMYLYEIYNGEILQDILIVDCGAGFPKARELGVDLIIPDISYLKDKTDKIRAILLTHAHEDHILALKFHYKDLGSPPIYASKLTMYFVQSRFEEVGIRANVTEVEYGKEYIFGDIKAEFIHVTHSIPDPTHILLTTPVGRFYHGSDFKLDLTPPYGNPPDFYRMTKAGTDGVLCLLSDCLGADREGLTLSESVVGSTFEDLIRSTKGKFIMTTFASNISRMRQCVDAAVKFNRKICFIGRSMKQNSELAKNINYLPINPKFLIKEEEVSRQQPNKVCLIVAGSQGQFGSALSKMADNHNRFIKLTKDDRVMFSSDPIPGNEGGVNDIIEKLYYLGADVIYSGSEGEIHASGHGNQDDLKLLVRFTNPKYLIPIGGTVKLQRRYQKLMNMLGYTDDKILMLNDGDTIWFEQNRVYKGEKVIVKNIYVDAYGVGDIGNFVLRDRRTLAEEGIVFIAVPISPDNKLAREAVIASRGFVFKGDESSLFNGAQVIIQNAFKDSPDALPMASSIERSIIEKLEEYFKKETGREPLVIVEMLEL